MDTLHSLQLNSLDKLFNIEGSAYEKRQKIGSGTYGIVYTAVNRRTGQLVAVKKVCNVFDNLIIARRTYREIKILRHFRHENIIRIRDILRPREKSFSDVYLVFDLMDTDLHQVIHSKQELTDQHVRYFLYQILRGLKYIHSANVIHRDLKPSNLLVNENCDLKIGDFGMARAVNYSSASDSHCSELLMTQYVMTRWYRAPELMLFRRQYTVDVDMWSVGCIFAEMVARHAIFRGTSLNHQLTLIVNTLGSPDVDFVSLAHADRIKDFLLKLKPTQAVPLTSLLPGAHPKAIRLLQQMLRWHPSERISVESALRDLYVNHYHEPSDEPVCSERLDFMFDEDKLDDIDVLRRLISDEIGKSLSDSAGMSSCTLTDNTGHQQQNTPSTCNDEPPVVDQQRRLTTDSNQSEACEKSSALLADVRSSSLLSSGYKVVRRRGKTSRQSAQLSGGQLRKVSLRSPVAHRRILPTSAVSSAVEQSTTVMTASSTVDAKAILRAAILSGSRQKNIKQRGGRQRHTNMQHQPALNTSTDSSVVTQLTDEDKGLLQRWQQMQQQQDSKLSVTAVPAEKTLTTVTTTTAAAAAAAACTVGDTNALTLSSADSQLADRCLADTQLIWSPSVNLSSADIAGCLHSADDLTHISIRPTVIVSNAADGNTGSPDGQQRSSAGYGTGELIPLFDSSCEPILLDSADIDLSALLSEDA